MKALRKDSTLADVAQAMAEAGMEEDFGSERVSNAAVEHVGCGGSSWSTVRDDIRVEVEAWVVEWDRHSWYLGRAVHRCAALIDRTTGGLVGGEGQACLERFAVSLADRADLDVAVAAVVRRCVPKPVGVEEY